MPGNAVRRGAVGFLLAASASACGERGGGGAFTRTDSAGVEIVESSQPRQARWRLSEAPVLEIAEALVEPASVTADVRGRVQVADRGAPGGGSLAVYDRDGRLLVRAGGEGAFRQLWWAAPYRGDSLLAFDLGARALRVLTPDGSLAREVPIPAQRREGAYGLPGYAPGAVGAFADGAFLTYAGGSLDRNVVEGPAWYRHDLLRVSPEGERWDTLGTFEIFKTWLGPGWTAPYPFGSVAFRSVRNDGFLFTDGETFEVREYGPDGALRRILRRPHTGSPVNAADLEAYRRWYAERAQAGGRLGPEEMEQLTQQLERPAHPERRPAISNLLVDDQGNAWVEEFRWVDPLEPAPDPRPGSWTVFDRDGRWLAQVEVPAGFLPTAISDGRVYGIFAGADGRRVVRAYRLLRR